MSATTPPAGWLTETASGTFDRADAQLAAEIEAADRQALKRLGMGALIREFMPGERRLREVMGCPVRPEHAAVAVVVSPDGAIDRKPLTLRQASLIAAAMEAGR